MISRIVGKMFHQVFEVRRATVVGILLTCVFLAGASASWAAAAKWPDKPITFVVPVGPGGGLDTSARLLAKYWEKELGTSIVVVNRPGAGTLVGTTHFLGLPDDGSAVLLGAQISFSNTIVTQDASYKFDDISLLSFIAFNDECLSVLENSPYQTFEALNTAIQENPGKIRFAVVSGTPAKLMFEALKARYGWDVKIVNYNSAAERQSALLGGHIDVCTGGINTALRNDEKILLIMGDERNKAFPDVPVLNELIDKPVNANGTYQFVAVHSTLKSKYPERYQLLLDSLTKTWNSDEFQSALKEIGMDKIASWQGPEESALLNRKVHETVTELKDSLK